MMNMMSTTTGWGLDLSTLWALHMLSTIGFFAGIALLLIWAFKHMSQKQLQMWGWTLVIVGAIGCLITIGVMGHPWAGMGMGYGGSTGMMRMMPGNQNAGEDGESEAQQKEEEKGKALYEKLQAKQAACTDLSDDDFELIGEYLMGQQAGVNHEQMNAMMKQMMGDEGEVQMHIIMARNATGCRP